MRRTDANGADFRAGEQGFAYRRGFVLGLTLAETALLLVFVILLLLAVGFERRDREIQRLGAPLEALRASLPSGVLDEAQLIEELERLAELRAAAQAAGLPWDDTFVELVRAVAQAEGSDGLMDVAQVLKEKREKLDRIQATLETLGEGKDLAALAETNADQADTIDNQRGQLRQLMERLNREGKGGVLPSCWSSPEGKIEFVMDVVLDAQGIRARDTSPERRADERERLAWPTFPADGVFSPASFSAATKPLFDWSAKNDCRFYVVVFDATGNDQKALYKDLLQTVEGHFYKRLSRDAAAF